MGFFADRFGTPKPAPAVIIYNVLHEEIDRVEGGRYLWGQDLCGRNWSHADLSGLSLYGAQCDGINLFSAHGYTGQTSKRHHFAAQSFRSVTQPVRIFVVLICGDVHFIEQWLVCCEVGTYLRISPTRWSMRPATYPNLKCLANAGCE